MQKSFIKLFSNSSLAGVLPLHFLPGIRTSNSFLSQLIEIISFLFSWFRTFKTFLPLISLYDLLELDKKIYGPIIIQTKSYKDIKGRKVLNVLTQENKKLILSINCDKNELDIRVPGRKWMGGEPAKEEFENNLINDFC